MVTRPATAAARDEERNRLARNPHLKLADQVQHGYGVLTLSRTEAEFAFRRVDKNDADAGVGTPYTLRVERGTARLDRADGGRAAASATGLSGCRTARRAPSSC